MLCFQPIRPAECQKLPGDGLGAVPCVFDLAQALPRLIGDVVPEYEQFGMAVDGHQQVVEVVGDSA